jgi:hypothetical protein
MSTDTVHTFRHTDAAQQWATSPERKPLFSVVRPVERPADASDDWEPYDETVEYTMPAKPNPGLALEYLRLARKQGDLANSWLIEVAVGEKGYDALVEELSGVEDGDKALGILRALTETIQKVAMGGLEKSPGV